MPNRRAFTTPSTDSTNVRRFVSPSAKSTDQLIVPLRLSGAYETTWPAKYSSSSLPPSMVAYLIITGHLAALPGHLTNSSFRSNRIVEGRVQPDHRELWPLVCLDRSTNTNSNVDRSGCVCNVVVGIALDIERGHIHLGERDPARRAIRQNCESGQAGNHCALLKTSCRPQSSRLDSSLTTYI